jgi:hypothetical protein
VLARISIDAAQFREGLAFRLGQIKDGHASEGDNLVFLFIARQVGWFGPGKNWRQYSNSMLSPSDVTPKLFPRPEPGDTGSLGALPEYQKQVPRAVAVEFRHARQVGCEAKASALIQFCS